MKYLHIIFDLDGTLVNPEKGIRDSFQYAIHKMNAEVDLDNNFKNLIGPPLHHGFSRVLGFSDVDADRAVCFYREYYARKGLYDSILYEGVIHMMERLHSEGKKLYLATSKLEKYAVDVLRHTGIGPFFEFVAGAEYKGTGAEKDYLIRLVLDRIPQGVQDTAVMIGDTRFDIIGARATGIDSVGVLYGFGTRAELQKAGATHLARDPAQLERILTTYR